MAVGKGSMERAAKAAGTDPAKKSADDVQMSSEKKTGSDVVKNTKRRKTSGNRTAPKQSVSKQPAAETPAAEASAAETETEGQIVYQKSSGMLERPARPNEQFGLGDAMPVYYF